MSRLVQWDPFRIRVDADAVRALVAQRVADSALLSGLELVFSQGAIEFLATAGGAPVRGRVTIVAASGLELKLAIAIHAGRPILPPNIAKLLPAAAGDVLSVEPMVVSLSLASLLPAFVDVNLSGAEIGKDGVTVFLGPGGADPPPS
jgi:hypothetical protein